MVRVSVGCLAVVLGALLLEAPSFVSRSQSASANDKESAGGAAPPDVASYDAFITPSDRQHWAFQRVRPQTVPQVKDAGWVRNPIDRFILAPLEAKEWQPAAPVEPRGLLRRMFLDVVGLPPALEEQSAIDASSTPEVFDRLADELLSRPAYGERWARHWLDLVRYAETNGYERDGMKPNVRRYRDYVIRSFNDDKPYDRFVREQLAGDELPDANTETVLALGYYRLGPWDDEPADRLEDRFDQLDDMVATTSQAFLGLTLGCARCHNHKFEPLSTLDYYRMVAVFNPLQRFQGGRGDHDAFAATPAERNRLAERDRQIDALRREIAGQRDPVRRLLLEQTRTKLPVEAVAAFLAEPSKRTPDQKKLVESNTAQLESEVAAALSDDARAAVAGLEGRIAELRAATPDPVRGYYLYEPTPTPPATNVLLRGRPTRPGVAAPPGVPTVLVPRQPEFPAPDSHTSRRRLVLANWIASPENPLTARVIVNRVWQYHFGQGIVRTPSDFGVMGDSPTHPELLDWLAGWFVDQGWSIKKLHRLILTSATYRMSRQSNGTYAAADPENRLWWRVPYRRLEVETIRDSMLVASGRLNPAMFGPSMYPFVPKEVLAAHSDPNSIWRPFDEQEASRRTIYAHIKRSMVVPMLEVLDLCDTTRSSAARGVTSVPSQALTLFNGHFVNEQARHFAARLVREAGADPALQIDRACRLALCRPPTAAEQAALVEFLKDETEKQQQAASAAGTPADPVAASRRALEQMCRVIFNLNEFVYSD